MKTAGIGIPGGGFLVPRSPLLVFLPWFFAFGAFPGEVRGLPQPLVDEDEAALIQKLKERTPRDEAIEKGVAFLLSKQNAGKDDAGSFGDRHKTALTGLTVTALMAAGITPDDPRHGPKIRQAIEFVLSQMLREKDLEGYLGRKDNSRMYGHGICTLMLTEAAGMTSDENLEKRLIDAVRKAVRIIILAQQQPKDDRHKGGWRYEPGSRDSDLSLTGWQTMALRAARNIGVEVPEECIAQAIAYIRRMAGKDGGFGYESPTDHATLRGVGLLALPVCGVYDAEELVKTTKLLLKEPPKFQGPWFYYSTYYNTMGMYQMGDDAWNRFYPRIDAVLLKHQQPDGAWPEAPGNNEFDNGGPVYTTAMALLSLTVHYHLLPIYQR